MDEGGRWWLIEDGQRRKNSWSPKDEVDMLVGVALLYILADKANQFSIPAEYAQKLEQGHRSAAVFRELLMVAAMRLYRRIRF